MSLEIRVDTDEVTAALDELDRKASRKVIQGGIRKAMQYLKPPMKAEAPRGPTGNLRKKVGYRVRRSRKGTGDYYGVVRSFARHHHLVVAGTKERFTKSGAFRGVMPTNDYVSRVADRSEDTALSIAENEIARQLGLD